MSRTASSFRKIDVKRAIQAVEMAGKMVASIEVKPEGTIIVYVASQKGPAAPKPLLVL